jgi:hypothetical protein
MKGWNPTAQDIKQALSRHHSKDVFVDECKNGPTWVTSGLAQLDAWVLRRSWSPVATIGYEIKISRADFEQDQKWPSYLPLCHVFYFVCPAGLIKSTDLPKGVGLKWYSRAGNIHTKLHADRHEPDPEKLLQLFYYLVMCRSQIVKDPGWHEPDHLQTIRDIVASAEARQELASIVGAHVQSRHTEMLKRVRAAEIMEREARDFADRLATLGIHWDPAAQEWSHTEEVRHQIGELVKGSLDDYQLSDIKRFGGRMIEFSDKMKELKQKLRGVQ